MTLGQPEGRLAAGYAEDVWPSRRPRRGGARYVWPAAAGRTTVRNPPLRSTLPDKVDHVFVAEPLPCDGLYRVAIAVEGLATGIPTAMIAVTLDRALDVCDRLNTRFGHDRASWTAFADRGLRDGAARSGRPY